MFSLRSIALSTTTALISFALIDFTPSQGYALGAGLVAPQVDSEADVKNPEQGEIIFDWTDSNTGTFKGYQGAGGGWVSLTPASAVEEDEAGALKIIRGTFQQTGATTNGSLTGSGYSVNCTGTGLCTVTFSSSFSGTPSCNCSEAGSSGLVCGAASASTSSFIRVTTDPDAASAVVNTNAAFICIGPK